MSKTPDKNVDDTSIFTSRVIPVPDKVSPMLSQMVFTHVSNLRKSIDSWNKLNEDGVKFCKEILALKLHECEDDYFPSQLQRIMDGLVKVLSGLKIAVEAVDEVTRKLGAVAKLQSVPEPVFLTWSAAQVHETVTKINTSMQKEFKLKQVITENIAHCRDVKLIDVYVSAWEVEPYFEPNAYLYAEVGIPGNT